MADSESGFHDALGSLISESAKRGTDVTGGWDVEDSDGNTIWTVEITEVTGGGRDAESREATEL